MIIKYQDSDSVAEALGYCEGSVDSKGRKREFPPDFLSGRKGVLPEAREGSPVANSHNSFALAFSAPLKVLEKERMRRVIARVSENAGGGLPYCRVPDVAYGHFKRESPDGHLVQLGHDLLTGRQYKGGNP